METRINRKSWNDAVLSVCGKITIYTMETTYTQELEARRYQDLLLKSVMASPQWGQRGIDSIDYKCIEFVGLEHGYYLEFTITPKSNELAPAHLYAFWKYMETIADHLASQDIPGLLEIKSRIDVSSNGNIRFGAWYGAFREDNKIPSGAQLHEVWKHLLAVLNQRLGRV